MSKTVFWFTVVGFLLATSCTLGPKYVKPSAPLAPAYKELGDWKIAQPSDAALRGEWWALFDDPELSRLEEKVNISNQNIAASAANLQLSRAAIRAARAQYYPSVTANPAITNSRLSTAFGQTVGVTYTAFSLPFEASWEPDLWGRIRKTVQASTLAAQVSAADLENARLSAQADLAADYYDLRGQDALKQVLDATVAAYTESLELTVVLYKSGLGNDDAVAQAEAQLKGMQAQDTSLGILRAQYEHAIAILTGEAPSTFSIRPATVEARLPRIPVGVPSELLERRPDIAAAERAVAQANAQIGIAKTAFFPAVTLSGALGLQSLSAARLIDWPSRVWSVGPALAHTIFDAGSRRAAVQQYQAAYDQTVANYRQTVLTAFQQVEDNLSAARILQDVVTEQQSAVEAAERNLGEAQVRYRAGLDPYLNVISAETVLLNDQQTAVSFRTQQMVASVQLIKALGGGWDRSKLSVAADLDLKH